MTKPEIRAWLATVIITGDEIVKQWEDEADCDWHGDLGGALGALRAARESLESTSPQRSGKPT